MYSIFEELLQKHGVSTYKVSKDTGIAQSVFSSWKNGISTPKQDKMQKIADYFNVSIEYLTTGIEKEGGEKYYLNEETTKMAQTIFENKELRMLFDAHAGERAVPAVDVSHLQGCILLKNIWGLCGPRK